jgi:hypothetical protein
MTNSWSMLYDEILKMDDYINLNLPEGLKLVEMVKHSVDLTFLSMHHDMIKKARHVVI